MTKAVLVQQNCNRELLDRVYNKDSMEKASKYAEFYPEIINRENLQQHKEYLINTEIIFSTWGMTDFTEEELQQYFPRLKAVFYGAGSVQAFARPFLNRGITVVSAWAANAVPVAEYTLAQILLANKGYYQNVLKAKTDYEAARRYSGSFPGNYNTNVGILGAGMIGKMVVELLKPFRLNVLVFDPFLPEESALRLGVRKCSLTEIFSQCHTISNHIANLPQTVGLINKEHFNIMLPEATFINTGRGAQVVEEDMIEALKAEPSRTALLDVTNPEPPAEGSELYKLPNVFLTTHIAGSFGSEIQRMGCYMADEFEAYSSGRELKFAVTLKMLETMA